jgi:hypothetical protein
MDDMTTYEKWERADDEVFHLSEAIDHLEQVRDCDDLIDVIKDRMLVAGFEREQYHRMLEDENRREDEALSREYMLATI